MAEDAKSILDEGNEAVAKAESDQRRSKMLARMPEVSAKGWQMKKTSVMFGLLTTTWTHNAMNAVLAANRNNPHLWSTSLIDCIRMVPPDTAPCVKRADSFSEVQEFIMLDKHTLVIVSNLFWSDRFTDPEVTF